MIATKQIRMAICDISSLSGGVRSTEWHSGFYPRDALHSAVYAVVRYLSVSLSHVGIVSKRLNLS